jgi:hypothetical protein
MIYIVATLCFELQSIGVNDAVLFFLVVYIEEKDLIFFQKKIKEN